MAKFMVKANYTVEGTKGVLKGGGSARRAAVGKAIEGIGGRMECFYFAMGEADAVVIFDVPDVTSAAALSLAVNASGAAHTSTVVLLTPEQIDEAAKKSVSYRAPGA